jgi:hypothetical protein
MATISPMSDRSFYFFGLILATILVGGVHFVIGSKGGQILHGTRGQDTAPSKANVQQLRTNQVATSRADTRHSGPTVSSATPHVPPPTSSGIYRCTANGSVVYSDRPCANGRELDLAPNSGFNPIQPPRPRPSPETQQEGSSPARQAPSVVVAQAGRQDSLQQARCAAIEAELAKVDALARAGGTASYQDQLRVRRHKLIDEKYELKC